jgi:hypothetical protein
MKKNNLIIIGIILLVLILGFFVWSSNIKHQEVPQKEKNIQIATTTVSENIRSTSTSVALGWTNYSNSIEGFSIDYPSNFTAKEQGAGGPISFSIEFGDKKILDQGGGIISVAVSSAYKNFEEYFKDIQDSYQIDKRGEIDGNPAIFYSFNFSSIYNYTKRAVISHDNEIFIIETYSYNKDYRKATADLPAGFADNFLSQGDYERVISSFKFLK